MDLEQLFNIGVSCIKEEMCGIGQSSFLLYLKAVATIILNFLNE